MHYPNQGKNIPHINNPVIMTSYKNLLAFTVFLLFFNNAITAQTATPGDEFLRRADDYKKNQQPDSAIIYYEKASFEFKKAGDPENLINAYNQLGTILTRQDKYEEAKSYLEKALTTGLSLPDTNNLFIATTYITLGVINNAEENYNQSLIYHNKALAIRLLKLGEYHAEVATSYGNIGNVYLNSKNFDKSIEAHLKAMKIRAKVFGVSGAEIIESYANLGRAYREKKEYKTSLDYFEKALNNKIKQRGEGHKDLMKYYKNISELYYLMENKEQGDLYKTKAERL